MSSLGISKHEALIDQIRRMPGLTFDEQRGAYAALIEERLREVSRNGDEWHALMRLWGYVTGGMCRFEREFPIEFLPQVSG